MGVLLLVGVEARKKPGQAKARARKARTERSWHVAGPEGEESCGNYTNLLTTETPSSQCSEVSSEICICSTRDSLEEDGAEVTWKFICGQCELKWKPSRDEEVVKKRKQEKKKANAEQKARKKEMRRKMRMKLKGREGRQEKMKRRKQANREVLEKDLE